MAKADDNHSTDEFRLLWDEFCFAARLVHSEPRAGDLVRSFLEEGELDRDGRLRYRIWQIEALPGGAPSPYDGSFWRSDHERGIHCEIDHRNSSARGTGPVSAGWLSGEAKIFGRKTAEYRIKIIWICHELFVDFLRGVGLLPLVQQPTEAAAEPAAEPTQPEPEVAMEAADTAAVEAADDTAVFAAKGKKKKREGKAKLRIAEAAKKLWPPDGIVPRDVTPPALCMPSRLWTNAKRRREAQCRGKKKSRPILRRGPLASGSCGAK
jgi:hypothetical protein